MSELNTITQQNLFESYEINKNQKTDKNFLILII